MCVYYIYIKDRESDGDKLGSVGPGHDVDSIE